MIAAETLASAQREGRRRRALRPEAVQGVATRDASPIWLSLYVRVDAIMWFVRVGGRHIHGFECSRVYCPHRVQRQFCGALRLVPRIHGIYLVYQIECLSLAEISVGMDVKLETPKEKKRASKTEGH